MREVHNNYNNSRIWCEGGREAWKAIVTGVVVFTGETRGRAVHEPSGTHLWPRVRDYTLGATDDRLGAGRVLGEIQAGVICDVQSPGGENDHNDAADYFGQC